MNLTEHFTLEELTHTDHRSLSNTPNEAELANLKRLAEFLEKVKTVLGGKPIMVNSAFRSKAVNDAVGSKDTSQHRIGETANALPVRRRDGVRLTHAQLEEFAQQRRLDHALGLVGSQQHGLAHGAQVPGDVVVLRRQAGTDVDHEDHRISLGHGLARLLGHFLDDAAVAGGLEAARVDDDELAVPDATVTVVAVTGQPGKVSDDGVAALRHPVEQGRFADIRSANDGDDWFHLSELAGSPARGIKDATRTGRRSE